SVLYIGAIHSPIDDVITATSSIRSHNHITGNRLPRQRNGETHERGKEEGCRHRPSLVLDQPVGGHPDPLPVFAGVAVAQIGGGGFLLFHDASPLTFMMLCCSSFWVLPHLGGRHSGLLRDLVAPNAARRAHRARHGRGPMPLVRGG